MNLNGVSAFYLTELKKILSGDSPGKQYLDGYIKSLLEDSKNLRQLCDQANPRAKPNFRYHGGAASNRAGQPLINPFALLTKIPDELYSKTGRIIKTINAAKGDYEKGLDQISQCYQQHQAVDPGIILQQAQIYIVFHNQDYTRELVSQGAEPIQYIFLVIPLKVGNPSETQNVLKFAIKVQRGFGQTTYNFDQLYKLKRIIHYHDRSEAAEPEPNWSATRLLYPDQPEAPTYFEYTRPPTLNEFSERGITETANIYFLIAPLLKGITIQEILDDARHTIDLQTFLELIIKVVIELYIIHANGFVFSDVKPANILISNLDVLGEVMIRLLDFEQIPTCYDRSSRTTTGTTPGFTSPQRGTRYTSTFVTPSKPAARATLTKITKDSGHVELINKHLTTISRLRQQLDEQASARPNITNISIYVNTPDAKSDIFGLGMIILRLFLTQLRTSFKEFIQTNNLSEGWEKFLIAKDDHSHVEENIMFIDMFKIKIIALAERTPSLINGGHIHRRVISLILHMITTTQEERLTIVDVLEQLLTIYSEAYPNIQEVKFEKHSDTAFSADDLLPDSRSHVPHTAELESA